MKKLAELVEEGMRRKGWSLNRLSVEVGVLPSGRIVAASQIRRLRLGEQQDISKELLDRLIEVLGIDADEAYEAADRWPRGVTVDAIKELLDARERSVIAGEGEFAAKQRARRGRHRRPGPTPPAATTLATIVTTAAALFGPRAEPLVSRVPEWAPAEERRAA